jgi:tetratricopeptide (TPR) repeat protein
VRQLSTTISAVFVAASLAAIGVTHAKLNDAMERSVGPLLEPSLVPTAQSVRLVSLGFDQVIADYYWLAFIGYIGDTEKRKVDKYELADDYLELITDLDPQFVQAYWFTTFTVSGDQRNPSRAAEILDSGIRANPNNWYLPFIAGINQYLYAHNELSAAKYYRMASKYPDAPGWLERQANILETKTPRLIKEAYSWLNIYNSAEEERVREHAKERCIWLWVKVYKSAPNDVFRQKAKETLSSLGVDVEMFSRLRK